MPPTSSCSFPSLGTTRGSASSHGRHHVLLIDAALAIVALHASGSERIRTEHANDVQLFQHSGSR